MSSEMAVASLLAKKCPDFFDFNPSKEPQGEDSGQNEELIDLVKGDTHRVHKRMRTKEMVVYSSDEEESVRTASSDTYASAIIPDTSVLAITPVGTRVPTLSTNENLSVSIPVVEPVLIRRRTSRRAKSNVDPRVRAFIESERGDADRLQVQTENREFLESGVLPQENRNGDNSQQQSVFVTIQIQKFI